MPARKPARAKSGRLRGRPTSADAAALERRLLRVALQEFLQHGYGGASMTRIVSKAGVSKTTLYSRFPSRAALFHAIVLDQIDELSPSTPLAAGDGPPDLRRGLEAYADHMLKRNLQGELLGVNRLIHSESHRFPELAAAAAERNALGIQRIASFIRACARADGVACADPEGVAELFIAMIRGWYTNVMLANSKVSAARRRHWVERAVSTLLASRRDW